MSMLAKKMVSLAFLDTILCEPNKTNFRSDTHNNLSDCNNYRTYLTSANQLLTRHIIGILYSNSSYLDSPNRDIYHNLLKKIKLKEVERNDVKG